MNKNIVWHNERVSRSFREKLNKNRGVCVWLTGLSGSGKSTIANELDFQLNAKGVHTYLLDGDNIRHGLNSNLDFSESGRKENIRRIGEVSKLFVDAGIVVIAAFISPFEEDRENVRKLLNNKDFVEIFVQCALETCELRDPKGLYKKARLGEISDFTGISSPYEEPKNPELIIDNGKNSDLNFNVEKIIQYLENKTYIDKI